MKIALLLKEGINVLKENDIEEAENDAWLLLSDTFKMSRSDYYLNMTTEAKEKQKTLFLERINKRIKHVPLQYILGEWDFMGLTFKVNEHVLIPRQDTECLVEEAIKQINQYCKSPHKELTVLDMCTGSGCIGISLVNYCEGIEVTAVDLSGEALEVAKQNVRKILLPMHKENRITLVQSDLFEKVTGQYDFIVSNPPYIKTNDIKTLMPEVRDYEPIMALDGEEDGLIFYRKIIENSCSYLKDGGILMFEIGCTQGEQVKQLLVNKGFTDIEILKDLPGLDRVVIGKNGGNRNV